MSLVNISIVGNLIKPPQQFSFSSGRMKTTLIVAVDVPNRKRDDGRPDSDIYRVEAWGKLGEIAHKYLAQGNLVGATGRLVMQRWQDREGRDRVTPTVEAFQIALPPKPKAGYSQTPPTNPVAGEMQFDELDKVFDEEESTTDTASGDNESAAPPPAVAAAPESSAGPAKEAPEMINTVAIMSGTVVAHDTAEYWLSAPGTRRGASSPNTRPYPVPDELPDYDSNEEDDDDGYDQDHDYEDRELALAGVVLSAGRKRRG
jgi:single-strand DNA-binding protein